MNIYDAVIVGSGHGGAHAAIALRQHGFSGSIAIVSKDNVPPYERPPLSKEYLARDKAFERILIRPEHFWADKDVELIPNLEVVSIDSAQRVVRSKEGRSIGYGELIWSAGGSPRRLTCAGNGLNGVHAIRDKADVDAVMTELDDGAERVVVIGGGYIGLEGAAVLRKLGCEVVLLEAFDRVLARVAGEELSRFFEAEHRRHGVDLRLETLVDCLEGDGTKVTGVRLADGEVLACDMVIVGIGIEPSIGPLADAGASIFNGVKVDQYCRTTLPNVYAIGDCAAHANAFAEGAIIRLESVQNASDMATIAAQCICGKPEPYHALPWFWSNQYDLKLQTAGLSTGHDARVLRGDPQERSFALIYMKEGRVIALDCVNAVKDYVQGRRLVEARSIVPARVLSDPTVALKNCLQDI